MRTGCICDIGVPRASCPDPADPMARPRRPLGSSGSTDLQLSPKARSMQVECFTPGIERRNRSYVTTLGTLHFCGPHKCSRTTVRRQRDIRDDVTACTTRTSFPAFGLRLFILLLLLLLFDLHKSTLWCSYRLDTRSPDPAYSWIAGAL